MKYSVQNSSGTVYGVWNMPESARAAEAWATDLGEELADILGTNGTRSLPISDPRTGEEIDRVIVDIDPKGEEESRRLERVHGTIAAMAIEEELKAD